MKTSTWVLGLSITGLVVCAAPVKAVRVTFYPTRDGTLADGHMYGTFDGTADHADWVFNDTNYDGSITLTTEPPEFSLEHRVVWEYSLSTVSLEPPITATLKFFLRGATSSLLPDAEVFVYSYPADLLEKKEDFSSGPAVFQGRATVIPYHEAEEYMVSVTEAVNEVLISGVDKVGFRFQINPGTREVRSQAFFDARDSDPTTKPALILEDIVPGDTNADDAVDLADWALFAECMDGADIDVDGSCSVLDLDKDGDLDLRDFRSFQTYFSGPRP